MVRSSEVDRDNVDGDTNLFIYFKLLVCVKERICWKRRR